MRDIQALPFRVFEEIAYPFTDQISEWAGRVVRVIQDLPFHMQNNSLLAYGVIVSVNLIFFSMIHFVINEVEKENDDTNTKEKIFNFVVFDLLVTGTLALGFNVALSKVTQFPLNTTTLAIITTSYVALRMIFNQGKEIEGEILSEEVEERKEVEVTSEAKHETGDAKKLVANTKKKLEEFQEKEKARAEKRKLATEKETASLEVEKKELDDDLFITTPTELKKTPSQIAISNKASEKLTSSARSEIAEKEVVAAEE